MKRLGVWCGAFSAATVLLIVATPRELEAQPARPEVLAAAVSTPTTTADRLTRVKTKSANAVNERVDVLKVLRDRVVTAPNLSSAHRAALEVELDAMTASLKETDSKVQADAEVTAAARDAAMIVTAYRVYVLEVPKVHLLIGLDDVTAVADTLQQLVTEAQQSLDALQAAGVDTGAARRKLTDVLPRIESLRNNAQAQSNALIGLEAKGYPGNKSTLQSARNSLDTARSSVKSIRSDLKDEASLVH